MRYENLGKSGLKVSAMALGSWLTYGSRVDDDGTRACVEAALAGGVTLLDTADVYAYGQAERALGRILEGHQRHCQVIASKCYFPMSDHPNDRGLSRKHVVESLHGSLRRLKTDYIDLYQCHRWDDATPPQELVYTMGILIRQGKILYWGVSCWSAEQIAEVCRLADAMGVPRPISNQPPYNLFERSVEAEVIPACADQGLGQIVFSPLAQGLLTGKYSADRTPAGSRASHQRAGLWLRPWLRDDVLVAVERLQPLAADLGATLAQLALAWCLHKPGIISVIFGASTAAQVEDNLKAIDLQLSDTDLEAIEAAVAGVRLDPAV
jgi:voltage-dependent potassium channel beta subunit